MSNRINAPSKQRTDEGYVVLERQRSVSLEDDEGNIHLMSSLTRRTSSRPLQTDTAFTVRNGFDSLRKRRHPLKRRSFAQLWHSDRRNRFSENIDRSRRRFRERLSEEGSKKEW